MNVAKYIDNLESRQAGLEEAELAARGHGEPDRPENEFCRSAEDEQFFESVERPGMIGLVELILKNRPRLHRLIRNPVRQPELVTNLLAISLIAFTFFGVAMTIVLRSAHVWPQLTAIADVLRHPDERLIGFGPTGLENAPGAAEMAGLSLMLIAAYALGLIAASGICLPSLYFFGLLSGVKMSMLDVTLHSLKAKATAAVALVGILPIYAAIAMGMVIFNAAEPLMRLVLWLGLILPFIAGLWGTHSLYVGFAGLCETMSPQHRERRECFLRRLVLAWSTVYSAVTPVMIFSLWQWFQSFGSGA